MLSHAAHQALHLKVAAQSLIFGRRRQIGENFAAYAQHPEFGLVGRGVQAGRGLCSCPGLDQRLGAAFGPELNARNEGIRRLFERVAIGRWGGTPFSEFLKRVGADTSAKYVGFKCADDYYESIDMPTALHSQTLLTFTYDGQQLPAKYGYPMKLRIPTKLGYKNPKHIMEIFVTNTFPGGYWVDQGYNWFGGS